MTPFDQLFQKYKSLRDDAPAHDEARAAFIEWCSDFLETDVNTSTFADLDMYYGDFLSAYFPEEKNGN